MANTAPKAQNILANLAPLLPKRADCKSIYGEYMRIIVTSKILIEEAAFRLKTAMEKAKG
jgi:hypothetical protein